MKSVMDCDSLQTSNKLNQVSWDCALYQNGDPSMDYAISFHSRNVIGRVICESSFNCFLKCFLKTDNCRIKTGNQ